MHRRFPLPLLLACLLAWAAPALAQDEDDEPTGETPAAAPARAPKADKGDKPAARGLPKDLKLEDPGVRAVIESQPKTPAELLQPTSVLIDLHRPEVAKFYFDELQNQKLDTKALAGLARKFGSPLFFKLARESWLAPEGGRFADAVLSASQAEHTNPKRLERLVAQLTGPDAVTQAEAMVELSAAHEAAVMPLVRVLADPARTADYPIVESLLDRMKVAVTGPLLALLDSGDPKLAAAAARALGALRARSALPLLLAPALVSGGDADLQRAAGAALQAIYGRIPTSAEASEFLRHEVKQSLIAARRERRSAEPAGSLWRFDAKTGQPVERQLPEADIAAARAARLAGDLYQISATTEDRQLDLMAQLSAAKLLGGLSQPLSDDAAVVAEAKQFGAAAVESVLSRAMAEGQIAAAIGAAEVLGKIGSSESLYRAGNALSPLAEALRSSDRRLRFAALNSILSLQPTRSFAGAGYVVPELAFFAGTSGYRRALVGHPRGEKGQQLVSLLTGLGYEADHATNSRQLMDLAVGSPDYELVMIHVSLSNPGVDDCLARLRRDPRTADLPVGLVAPPEMAKAAERLARSLPMVVAVPAMSDEKATQFQVDRVLETLGRDLASASERQYQAAVALDWLGRLSEQPQSLYDLQIVVPAVERALLVPGLSKRAALVLSNLPSAAAQRALLELADRTVLSAEVRETAAVAFRRSVRRHRVLLTSGQIQRQFQLYNASAGLDKQTQQIFGSLLDSIEGKDAADEPDPQP